MKRIVKRIILVVAVLLVVIQFFRPQRNEAAGLSPRDITTKYPVPEPVLQLLQRSCYDCHSNNTHYPWYNNIQPVAWILNDHIQEGKRELNFSEFAAYTPKKAAHKLDEVMAEVGEHEMPISSYTAIHHDAKLSEEEIRLISNWADALGDSIRTVNHLPMQ